MCFSSLLSVSDALDHLASLFFDVSHFAVVETGPGTTGTARLFPSCLPAAPLSLKPDGSGERTCLNHGRYIDAG